MATANAKYSKSAAPSVSVERFSAVRGFFARFRHGVAWLATLLPAGDAMLLRTLVPARDRAILTS